MTTDTSLAARPTAPESGGWAERAVALATTWRPRRGDHDREGRFVAGRIDAARNAGVLEMLVPAAVGGGGASLAQTCRALRELARGCPSTALTLSMHSHLVGAQVWRHHRDLPAPVLARVAAERMLLVSTGASDWIGSSGSAVAVEGGFRVSARKTPASGCPAGDVLITSIRWAPAGGRAQVLHCSIPFGADGVSVEPTWDAMGMRGTGSDTVVLDEVFVPDGAVVLVRPADTWHPLWGTVLGVALPLIMSVYVGVAEEAADLATTLGRRDAARSATVGRMQCRLTAATDAVAAMITAADDLRFEPSAEQAAAVLARKAVATEAVLDTVRLALEVAGGAGYARGAGLEQLVRDAHGALFHPLPTGAVEGFVGRVALGLDPVG